MEIENLLETAQPLIKIAIDANVLSKTLLKHYIKTMSELTGKSEEEIKNEIIEIEKSIKEELVNKINDDGIKGL